MVKIVQNSFLGGQLDFEMMGRQDVDKYAKGATTLKNFVPLKRGAIRKRHGTNFLHDVTARIANGKYRLVPFAYTQDEGWALLFTDGAILAISATSIVEVLAQNAALYSGDELDEIDYEQCGDILYIAHQSHPPCKIEHIVKLIGSVRVHTFTLKEIPINYQAEGIPEIVGATVSKTGITIKGPKITESYKVTAVFDGVETFPSDAYSNANCADYDEGYDSWQAYLARCDSSDQICSREYQPALKTYSGTSYTQPWTQSQKISLKIAVKTRVSLDGTMIQYPEQIRIYRKTGSFYGLVGFIDTSEMGLNDQADFTSPIPEILPSRTGGDAVGTDIMANESVEALGYGGDGFVFDAGETLKITLPAEKDKAVVTLGIGHVSHGEHWDWKNVDIDEAIDQSMDLSSEENRESVIDYIDLLSVTYVYTPSPANKYSVQLGNGQVKTITCETNETSVRTLTVERKSSDSNNETFALRARNEMLAWVAGFNNTETCSISVTTTSPSNTIKIVAYNGSSESKCVLNHISISTTADDTAFQQWDDKFYTPDVSMTPPTHELFMNEAGEYPACVCLSQQRLIWASTLNDPSRVIMSQIGNFDTYAPHDAMVADDPIDFQISATRFPKVNHIVELRKLLMFNGDSEWVVDSASTSSGITFETIQARQHSAIGVANWLKPIVCNNVLLFAERTGQAVRQYGYQLEDDGFGGEDVSIFSASIFRDKRIVSWVYQQHPHSTCWCVLSDGTLCSLTFMREQQTIAWSTHEFGGEGKARAVVCSHALVGRSGGLADTSQVFVLVERSGTWSIEELRPECAHGGDTFRNALCLDSMRILGYGDAIRSGAVAFDLATGSRKTEAAAGLVEGFTFESEFTSVHPVVKDDIGMAQMDVKCINGIHLRLSDAVGGEVRAIDVPASEASKLERTVRTVVPATSGDAHVNFPEIVDETPPLVTSNNRDGRVTITQSQPWPFTLLMLETDIECEQDERSGR